MTAIIDLSGKRGLVVDIANQDSIATGCATCFREADADLAVKDRNGFLRDYLLFAGQEDERCRVDYGGMNKVSANSYHKHYGYEDCADYYDLMQ